MFKLFKDLTRPPEPLSPRPTLSAEPSSQSPLPYAPRQQRGASPNPGSPNPATLPTPASVPEPKQEVEVEESDAHARTVAELLKKLEDGGDVMHYVETLSQINLVPQTATATGSFRRHKGFAVLTRVFGQGFRWLPRSIDDGEEWEVREVQRMEGAVGGYVGWLHIFRSLSAPTVETGRNPSSSSRAASPDLDARSTPDPKVLAHILSHALNDNYSILSLVTGAQGYTDEELREKLGEVTIRRGAALPLLWAYMWGLGPSLAMETRKGKERDYEDVLEERLLFSGEREDSANGVLVRSVLQILYHAAQSSVNVFAIRRHLPRLDDFLMTRLYGYAKERKYDITFAARDDWCDDLPDDEIDRLPWTAPNKELRTVYLALLRRALEGGVQQQLVWRLFSLVKVSANSLDQQSAGTSGISTPLTSPPLDDASQANPVSKSKARKRPKPGLQISTTIKSEDEERLDPEILELIRHCMKARWPGAFVFGGSGDAEGGLELMDMVKAWPNGQKGFNFSCWVYVSKLNRPITLIQASQANQAHPLFAVRILENSQIALISTTAKTAGASGAPPEETKAGDVAPDEIICAAPDALIPHHQWVHFAIGMRRPKGQEMGEARIFVNGTRVGAMRVPYPVPLPLPPPAPVHSRGGSTNASPAEAIRLSVGRDLRGGPKSDAHDQTGGTPVGKQEENEWMLGRTVLLEEAVPEDIVRLMHHLGPRYIGNYQEALGKFLTYEGATSINVYLSALALTAADKKMFTSPAHSILVRAIRQGPAFAEDSILLSLSAKDVDGDACINSAIPHPYRAKQVRNGTLSLVGDVGTHTVMSLDESVACVGGGTVILKMIDLSTSTEELWFGLGLLRDMIKDCWSASEEMERIRGFEMLAAILRPKMPLMVDTACAKVILAMLGINMDKPATATVHNSAAYRALGLEFELWSHASLGVVTLYLQHFEYLLSTSKHARYNVLRTFQKSAMVKKMLYALRSGYFDAEVVPVIVDTLKLALLARWSGEDAIKPVFSYLVSALCQAPGSYSAILPNEPPPLQVPAAQILAMISELSSQPTRLQKLNKSLALHRLLIIFISSNSAFYVIVPCLEILQNCLVTSGLEAFQRNFESEGGFALLAGTLGSCWRDDVQKLVFEIMLGTKAREDAKEGTSLACGQLVSTILAALDWLLQASAEGGDEARPAMVGRTRSGTITSIRSIPLTQINTDLSDSPATSRLELLLTELIATHKASHAFRRCMTGRKVEQMLPALADFAAVSSSSARPEIARSQRSLAAEWLQLIVNQSKISHTLLTQTKLIIEQLRSEPSSPKLSSSSFAMSPSSPRPATSYFGSSLSGRLSSTPPASPMLGSSLGGFGFSSLSGGGNNGPIPRRRPSTDAGPVGGMLGRSRSIVEMRAPLKRVLTGESVLEGGKDKNAAWKLIIIQTDSQSHSKMTLERKEHWQKLSEVEWPKLAAGLRAENGLWPDELEHVAWRLDGSEGPLRMRNRLERVYAAPELGAQRTRHKLRDAIPSVDELSSAVSRLNAAPWEDPFALALGEAAPIEEEDSPLAPPPQSSQPAPAEIEDRGDDESYVEVEENKDDKMRRIAKTLQAGDVVEEAHNIVRIVGVDACPGLLILGKKNLYLVDGLVQTAEGEVIDAKDAPRDVLSIPGTLVDLDTDEQESHRWGYNEIVENNKRAFLFRDVALELYFSDKRNFLIVFKDKRERQGVVNKLTYKSDQTGAVAKSVIGNFVLDQVARAIDRSEQQLEAMTRRWQHREISNFAYLMLLNQHANRTPNDVTQYPVFPWVLADYSSPKLDLDKVSTYRDLTLPMGALTPARKEAAVERYTATQGVGEQPFHYGTHYSSSMIVCGFLIRLSPFTEIFLALQGGNFDLADRLFSSIPRAWDSASADNRGDVRELIPEFFYSSAFMLNVNRHDFGRKQVTGDSVDNVVLPPWALEDPLLFIHRHREALESDFVSRHLHTWIDLTFGYKQRDPASYNCFHPLSYRGAVDLENISDDNEKAASTAIIHNFGQTPSQIFKAPHPHRISGGRSELQMGQRFGVAEGWQLLIRSVMPISETLLPIYDVEPGFGDGAKPITMMRERMAVPGERSLSIQWGFGDGSLRAYYQETVVSLPRLVLLLEGISIQHAIFAAPTLLVTVSTQGILTAWRLSCKNGGSRRGDVTLVREATLRGHTDTVTSITASSAWSLLVTGQEDGKAIVWDTNRLRYTRTLQTPHNEPLLYSAINDSDGHIALASSNHLYMFSLNGHPIASTTTDTDPLADFTFGLPESPSPQSTRVERFTGGITFLRRDYLRYGALFVIGIEDELALFRCVPGERRFEDEEVKPWRLVEQGRLARSGECGGQCCMVKFIGETLYAAFEPPVKESKARWKLYQWSLPEGDARHVHDSVSSVCMAAGCGRHFGLLDPKRHCGGCGGLFCGTHAVHVETFSMRYCELCRAQLAEASSLGIINSRRDSAYPTSRRGSLAYSASAPGSRRPSVSNGTSRSASRSASRPGSRSVSRVGSRRPSLSRGSTPTAGTSGFSQLGGMVTPIGHSHGLGISTGSGTHSPLGGAPRTREGTPSGP